MKIKLDKLEQKDRGIVREVKIPKTRDVELEKKFVSLVLKEKELDLLDQKLKVDEETNRIFLNKVITQGQQIEYQQDRNKDARAEIERLGDEQAKIIEETKNKINEENAKDEKTRRKQAVLDNQQIVIRAQNKLKIFDEKRAERDVQDEELKLSQKEAAKVYLESKSNYEKSVKDREKNEKDLSEVREQIIEVMQKGKKIGDDDFEQAKKDIEDIRKELKYKEIRPIGQNENYYIFLLIQPEEYEGDIISVKVEEKKDEQNK